MPKPTSSPPPEPRRPIVGDIVIGPLHWHRTDSGAWRQEGGLGLCAPHEEALLDEIERLQGLIDAYAAAWADRGIFTAVHIVNARNALLAAARTEKGDR